LARFSRGDRTRNIIARQMHDLDTVGINAEPINHSRLRELRDGKEDICSFAEESVANTTARQDPVIEAFRVIKILDIKERHRKSEGRQERQSSRLQTMFVVAELMNYYT
jgi:hypothetical protein